MAGKKKSKSKSKKKLKKRSGEAIKSRRTFIARRIEKVAEIESRALENISDNFRSSYTKDLLVDGNVTEARSIESDFYELQSYRYKDGDQEKLIISELGIQTDPDFGIVDTIGGILERAEFGNPDTARIFLSVDGEEKSREMRETLEETDPDLAARITFVRKLDRTDSADRVAADEDSDSGNDAPDQLDAFTAPKSKVFDSAALTRKMGEDPKTNILFVKRSEKYKKVVKKLDDYHAKVAEFKSNLGEIQDSGKLFNQYNSDMNNLALDLIEAIDNYTNSSATKDSDADKDAKKNVMQSLKDQVVISTSRRSTGDPETPNIYINSDIESLRAEYWAKTFKPLLNSQIGPQQGTLLGVGAQGPVRSVVYNLKAGIASVEFEAGIKIDSLFKTNDVAAGSGIPKDNPEQSKRAVASYELNRILGMDVIPKTEFIMRRNDRGDMEFGQAIAVVHGTEGQVKTRIGKIDQKTVDTFAGLSDEDLGEFIDYNRETGEAWNVRIPPVDVDYNNPNLQKSLSDLQILDNIIGHADRHPGNFIFETNGKDSQQITGVKGIDNDDTFGKKWVVTNNDPDVIAEGSKTPGVPPIIDVNTALNLASMNAAFFARFTGIFSNKLSPKEMEVASDRLFAVQKTILEKVAAGDVALPPGTTISDSDLNKLERLANMPLNSLRAKIKTWGSDTLDSHQKQDSYLGKLTSRLETEDAAPPIWK